MMRRAAPPPMARPAHPEHTPAELVHARWAMLGVAGILFTSVGVKTCCSPGVTARGCARQRCPGVFPPLVQCWTGTDRMCTRIVVPAEDQPQASACLN
eukprot:1139727-Pelagomonas_calceolata.AAC.3